MTKALVVEAVTEGDHATARELLTQPGFTLKNLETFHTQLLTTVSLVAKEIGVRVTNPTNSSRTPFTRDVWEQMKPSQRLNAAWERAKLSGRHDQNRYVHGCGTPSCLGGWLVWLDPTLRFDGLECVRDDTGWSLSMLAASYRALAVPELSSSLGRNYGDGLNEPDLVEPGVYIFNSEHEVTDETVRRLGEQLDAYQTNRVTAKGPDSGETETQELDAETPYVLVVNEQTHHLTDCTHHANGTTVLTITRKKVQV